MSLDKEYHEEKIPVLQRDIDYPVYEEPYLFSLAKLKNVILSSENCVKNLHIVMKKRSILEVL
jgi:hypothetical protein